VSAFTAAAIDEMPEVYHGAVRLAAAHLGVESFGLQVLDFPAGFAAYPEHDHAQDGQEEVYVVLTGSARFVVGGEEVALDPGRMLRVAPGTMRRCEPGPDGVRLLAIGCTPGGAYVRPEGFRA
jgi:mannose-6-phosphate isomerase-like protein (cupin superfamily)